MNSRLAAPRLTDNGNATSARDNHNKRDDYGDRGDGNHAERNIL